MRTKHKIAILLAAAAWSAVVAVSLYGQTNKPVTTFTDSRDGQKYRTTRIGRQVWMAENLNYATEGSKCYGEGGKVITGYDREMYDREKGEWITETISDKEIQDNCERYGRLYQWDIAMKACPAGFHLASNAEWKKLVNRADWGTLIPFNTGGQYAGKKLKSKTGWAEASGGAYDSNGIDRYGFSALPGGSCDSDDLCYGAGEHGSWWTATENTADYATYRFTGFHGNGVSWSGDKKINFKSVRCIQDTRKGGGNEK